MTTRRWMVAVAAIAVLLLFGPELLKFTPRGQRRLRAAADHASWAWMCRTSARAFEEQARQAERTLVDLKQFNTSSQFPHHPLCLTRWEECLSQCREFADDMNHRAAFHGEVAVRFEAAARRTWELDPYTPLVDPYDPLSID